MNLIGRGDQDGYLFVGNTIILLCVLSQGCVFVTLWTGARQAPLSIRFARQEYCSGLPLPSPGHFPNPGIEPVSPWHGRQILYHWTTWQAHTWGQCLLNDDEEKEERYWNTLFSWAQFLPFGPPRHQFRGRQSFSLTVEGGVISGWFKCIRLTVHFIFFFIIPSAPPQIVRCLIPEFGDPCLREITWYK